MTTYSPNPDTASSANRPRLAVVGGGVAGIVAAWLLWNLRAWDGREPLWAHLLARNGARS
ncbi:MAG: hypothetical protein AAB214_03460 [Fibrobacterota bacterium]